MHEGQTQLRKPIVDHSSNAIIGSYNYYLYNNYNKGQYLIVQLLPRINGRKGNILT